MRRYTRTFHIQAALKTVCHEIGDRFGEVHPWPPWQLAPVVGQEIEAFSAGVEGKKLGSAGEGGLVDGLEVSV